MLLGFFFILFAFRGVILLLLVFWYFVHDLASATVQMGGAGVWGKASCCKILLWGGVGWGEGVFLLCSILMYHGISSLLLLIMSFN